VARALVGLPSFRPNLQAGSGRALQLPASSWLGPCFSVSAIEDDLIKAEPSVWESCFKGVAAGSRNMVRGGGEGCREPGGQGGGRGAEGTGGGGRKGGGEEVWGL